MYRMFSESLANMKMDLLISKDSRSKLIEDFDILLDVDAYIQNREEVSQTYMRISDLLYYMVQHVKDFPRFSCFLWTLESRGMIPHHYGIEKMDVLAEKARLMNMLLNTTYWN